MDNPKINKYISLTADNAKKVEKVAKEYGCSFTTAVNIMLKRKKEHL